MRRVSGSQQDRASRSLFAVSKILVEGEASGPLMVLTSPLSFWGGVEIETGNIIDPAHPQHGQTVRGTILLMPHGRGSSSSATVLAETIRLGSGPVGLVLDAVDSILVTGAFVANALYGTNFPVIVAEIPRDAEGAFRIDSSGLRQPESE